MIVEEALTITNYHQIHVHHQMARNSIKLKRCLRLWQKQQMLRPTKALRKRGHTDGTDDDSDHLFMTLT